MKNIFQNKEVWFNFLSAIIAILLSVVLNQIYTIVGFKILIVSLLFIIILFGFNTLLILNLTKNKFTKEIDSIISLMLEKYKDTKVNSWLYNEAEIAEFERTSKYSKIILLSPDLKNDTGNSPYIDMIKNVLLKGTKYCYIVPDSEIINSRINDLKIIFSEHLEQLEIIFLPEDIFYSLTTTHIVIYEPDSSKSRKVVIELSVLDSGYWWIEVSKDYGDLMFGKILRVIKTHNIAYKQ